MKVKQCIVVSNSVQEATARGLLTTQQPQHTAVVMTIHQPNPAITPSQEDIVVVQAGSCPGENKEKQGDP